MNQVVKIEVPVEASTAAALADERRLAAIGQLIDRLVSNERQSALIAAMDRISAEARASGLTEAEVEAELEAYNAERRG